MTMPFLGGSRHSVLAALAICASGCGGDASPAAVGPGFSATGTMTTARRYLTATLLPSGKVLVTGGNHQQANAIVATATAELYDPATGLFRNTGSMSRGRAFHTATLLANGKVLIAGGPDAVGDLRVSTASAELYDPATETFTLTGSMNFPRAAHSATLLVDGTVLVAGGWDSGADLVSAEVYDPATSRFIAVGSMRKPREQHTATLLLNGRVLLAGGAVSNSVGLVDAEIYNPSTKAFTATGSMAVGRYCSSATRLLNGMVLVAGGAAIAGVSPLSKDPQLSVAELYDPATGTFTQTGSIHGRLEQHTATLLPNGRVALLGSRAELYDLGAGAFTLIDDNVNRNAHASVLLDGGRMLVVGGSSVDGGYSTAAAGLYAFD